ncbi:hypothetical protein OH146_11845 [Salinibacterium sp. SYSU T00001]|uniref:hypothetical protein n=1 Tax=Homoserinimonas sedimenticola TaxID=2986805 RepID=UPI002235D026|nr:hypothetical protein [Salinibacterium sedimenticola]MCW4386465.1 hypothetical protein [Salinibacterium sedimenticola]
MQWRSRRSDPAELAVLYSGVPPWMERPLLNWVNAAMKAYIGYGLSFDTHPNKELLQEFETATRRHASLLRELSLGVPALYKAMGVEEFLDFVDFLVFHIERLGWEAAPILEGLRELLQNAGSEWALGTRGGHASLEKRVPEGVVQAVDGTVAQSGSAGQLLAEAWHAVFGRSPDTEEAYEKAIKAVEEAGAHVVTPNNKKATLGTMVRDMKAQGDWKLDLPAADADVPVRMADALWIGQESRHGGNGYRKPTQEEAEAAVMLAVPLVQWFTSGALMRRP